MKKLLIVLLVIGAVSFGAISSVSAEEGNSNLFETASIPDPGGGGR